MFRNRLQRTPAYPQKAMQQALQLLRRGLLRGWRGAVLLLTALSFVTLVTAAATHQHSTTVEDRTCSICSTVANHLPDLSAPPLIVSPALILIFLLLPAVAQASTQTRRCLPPPSCGPPSFAT